MSTDGRKQKQGFWIRLRGQALTVLIYTAAQIVLALIFWRLLFRARDQGFALGLTLVGFTSWALLLVTGFRARSGMRSPMEAMTGSQDPKAQAPTASSRGKPSPNLDMAGCGTALFFSGLIVLALALVLRVHADMQTGKTLSDIFPSGP
jgi:hypothetical protein